MADQSRQIIQTVLKNFKLDLDSARRAEAEKRINIYKDNYKKILSDEIDNQFSKKTRGNVKQMIDDSYNILKRIINEISAVYHKSAKRLYVVNEKEDEAYKNTISMIPVDIIQQEINRFTNITNESFDYIVPRNGKIEYDIITSDKVEIFQNRDNPTDIDAILFCRTWTDTSENLNIEKIYWDVFGNHMVFDQNDQVKKKMENPYTDPNNPDKTIIPFTTFHKNYPIDSVFDETSGADLLSATIQLGVLLSYLNYLFKTQSFKQKYYIGIDIKDVKQDVIFDQLSPDVVKDPAGKVGVVDYQVSIDKFYDVIMQRIGAIANAYGLSLDNFKLQLSAQSGFALKIKSTGIQKVVDEQIKLYRFYEKDLFDRTKIVNNIFAGKKNDQGDFTKLKKIPDDGNFSIDFAEFQFPEAPEEIRKQWSFDIKFGAKSILDYIMFVNPDANNEKKAEELLKKNTETNERIKTEVKTDIDSLVEGVLKLKAGGNGGADGGSTSLI